MAGKQSLDGSVVICLVTGEREREREFKKYIAVLFLDRERNVVWFHVCVCVLCLERERFKQDL